MNKLIIIHDYIEDRINKDLDALRDSLPENERAAFEAERHIHRQTIINHIGDYGTYPEITGVELNPDANREANSASGS